MKDTEQLTNHARALITRNCRPDHRSDLLFTVNELARRAALYDAINTPEIEEFMSATKNEALHQREKWGVDHDGGKTDADWFWLIGYLAGKALHNPKRDDMTFEESRLHRIITVSAAALNWHAATLGVYARMRPGIKPPEGA